MILYYIIIYLKGKLYFHIPVSFINSIYNINVVIFSCQVIQPTLNENVIKRVKHSQTIEMIFLNLPLKKCHK